jgi:hypothetical protein
VLRRLNQLDLPDWFEKCHWLRERVCVGEPFIEGELSLHANGDCQIGRRFFVAGVAIDDWPFAGGCIAKRRSDRSEWLVIQTPAGIHHYYRYRRMLGIWERYTPVEDPALDDCVEVFGPRLGSFIRNFGRAITEMQQAVVKTIYVLFCMAIDYCQFLIVIISVLGILWVMGKVLGVLLP